MGVKNERFPLKCIWLLLHCLALPRWQVKGMDLAERCVVASRKERDVVNSNASGTDNFNNLLFLSEAVYSDIPDS
jgi:hypothetical protein